MQARMQSKIKLPIRNRTWSEHAEILLPVIAATPPVGWNSSFLRAFMLDRDAKLRGGEWVWGKDGSA